MRHGSGEHGGNGGGGGGSYSICRFTQMTAGYGSGNGTASIVGPYGDTDSDNVPDSIDKCPDTPNPLQESTVAYSGTYTWKDNNGSTIGTYTDPGNYYYNDTVNCILYRLRLINSSASSFNDPYLHSSCTTLTRHDHRNLYSIYLELYGPDLFAIRRGFHSHQLRSLVHPSRGWTAGGAISYKNQQKNES